MTQLRFSNRRNRARGLSLIELMVSIAIGMILTVAILSAYLSASSANKVAEAQGRMNEDAQVALNILSQQLRMAGNNPKRPQYASTTPSNPVYSSATYAIRACDSTFTDPDAADIQSLACSGNGPDSIAISYEADRYNTVKTAGGAATDCLGVSLPVVTGNVNIGNGATSVPTNVTYTFADNRFYIGTSGVVTAPSLYCRGNGTGGTKQPLVENIEDMQFVFGTAASTTTTMSVAGYLNASELLADAGLAALPDDQTRWGKVMSVRICVLVRSEQPVAPDASSAQYMSCPASGASVGVLTTPADANDRRLRRAYSTTVVLRNRVTP
jgi:type IV pilus assembly protein PilW